MAGSQKEHLRILPLIGSAAVVISVVLPWVTGLGTLHAQELPATYIVNGDAATSGVSLGVLLLIGAAIGAVLFSIDKWQVVRRIIGGLMMLLVLLFLAQLFHSAASEEAGLRLTVDSIGVGPYLTFVGGALLAAG